MNCRCQQEQGKTVPFSYPCSLCWYHKKIERSVTINKSDLFSSGQLFFDFWHCQIHLSHGCLPSCHNIPWPWHIFKSLYFHSCYMGGGLFKWNGKLVDKNCPVFSEPHGSSFIVPFRDCCFAAASQAWDHIGHVTTIQQLLMTGLLYL